MSGDGGPGSDSDADTVEDEYGDPTDVISATTESTAASEDAYGYDSPDPGMDDTLGEADAEGLGFFGGLSQMAENNLNFAMHNPISTIAGVLANTAARGTPASIASSVSGLVGGPTIGSVTENVVGGIVGEPGTEAAQGPGPSGQHGMGFSNALGGDGFFGR